MPPPAPEARDKLAQCVSTGSAKQQPQAPEGRHYFFHVRNSSLSPSPQNVGAPTLKVILEGFPKLKITFETPSVVISSPISSTTPPRQHCDASSPVVFNLVLHVRPACPETFRIPLSKRSRRHFMPARETEAIILKTFALGEADRLVSFLGRTSGRMRGVAAGARRIKN